MARVRYFFTITPGLPKMFEKMDISAILLELFFSFFVSMWKQIDLWVFYFSVQVVNNQPTQEKSHQPSSFQKICQNSQTIRSNQHRCPMALPNNGKVRLTFLYLIFYFMGPIKNFMFSYILAVIYQSYNSTYIDQTIIIV